ncbi:MAG: hypothetical protein JWN71_4143 [Xanthobacteraceae bacterium]|jgi:hypothetical protein|nr:hypothetical protein [Xanthobacteraceae bacterium]
MIKLVSALGLAALMLSPAMAATSGKSHRAVESYAQTAPGYAANGASSSADSPAVIVGGQYIGQDPDANVRLDLRREAGSEGE